MVGKMRVSPKYGTTLADSTPYKYNRGQLNNYLLSASMQHNSRLWMAVMVCETCELLKCWPPKTKVHSDNICR